MIFINKYATAQEVQDAVDNQELSKPYVAYITGEDKIDWNSKKPDYSKMYLTIEALEDGDFYVGKSEMMPTYVEVSYSVNGAEWETVTTATGETTLALNAGDTVRFKGTSSDAAGIFQMNTIAFNAYGNIESLGHGDDFSDVTEAGQYRLLFMSSSIVSAENLILPATTLVDSCYSGMFGECTGLTRTPELPATSLAGNCYESMFAGCTSLTVAPVLPATTLADSCYSSMFYGCTSLAAAPALPATTLANNCYDGMFSNCTNLTTAPALPVTTLAKSCYYRMFNGCSKLTAAPALPATTLADNCYYGMFWNCTNLTTAPALPATTLANSCYYYMFRDCTNLTTAPALPVTTLVERCYYGMFWNCTSLTVAPSVLPATTLAKSCYYAMFYGCTSLTTAPELPATTLTSYCYYQMFYSCTNLNYIKCLATNKSASNCTNNWVNGVASSGTFVKAASMTGWGTGANGIPSSWTVVEE